MKDNKTEGFIYLYASNGNRHRYNVGLQLFEYCQPAQRTFINFICCHIWGDWLPVTDSDMLERLKRELLSKLSFNSSF